MAAPDQDKPERWSGRSSDGQLSYELVPCEAGVLLERTVVRPSGRLIHSLLLRNKAAFIAWCEADDARFTHPLLFSEMRRRCSRELERASDGVV
jgi:hypothetical protein